MVTIYKNIFDLTPNYISIETALDRIKSGKSKILVDEIRSHLDKDRASKLKQNLPSVLFSGKFPNQRTDKSIIEHSGFIVLDFDYVDDVTLKKIELSLNEYIYACWVSPSGNGVKALVRIAEGKEHRSHFLALKEEFENLDDSGINESRVCYESYDENIFINKDATIFNKLKKVEKVATTETESDNLKIFNNILRWLSNKGDAFVKGERNFFMFKLASACCRFGINETDCASFCSNEFLVTDNSFTRSELLRVISSAYKSNMGAFGTAYFENEKLMEKTSRKEIELDVDIYNPDIRPKDVIFGEDVKTEALNIYANGYDRVDGIGVDELDRYFKLKLGEITLLSGIGNYGKSSFLKWYLLARVLIFKDKFAIFSPEDNPAQEFYHDITEMYLGMNCTPFNPNRPSREVYEKAYDFISKHFFYIYPKEIAPTPDYIKQRFLELIIKEKVTGCIIDPFNQMTNDYNKSSGRSDKYLETFLADCSRFAQLNNIYFIIVAHPTKMQLGSGGSYPCPNVFDIADGAMWNNKMDNILIYHRPDHQTNPNSNLCELHSKKIRRQKTVGIKGIVQFELDRRTRRFYFNGFDIIAYAKGESAQPTEVIPTADVDKAFFTSDSEQDIDVNDIPF